MNNRVTRNHISPAAIKKNKTILQTKKNLYLLVIISDNPILYKDGIIHFKTELIKVTIEGQKVVISFDILLLGKDEAVLGIPFL